MKILIAIDSFKDSLSAYDAGLALKKGLLKLEPARKVTVLPMADGGEGTVESVIDATGGRMERLRVMDPLMRETDSFYGITGDGGTAVIEMAAASGIEKLEPEERDPWITTTYGTGQLIADALDKGCRKIMIGIGGSATNDCGAGMAEALGVEFLDRSGNRVRRGGGSLGEVDRIEMGGLDTRAAECGIVVACDVTNPLTGPEGASHVYGPQKGADGDMVVRLDANLEHFAGRIAEQLGKEVSPVPGAGAAGGLGAGLIAFLDARLMKGFDMVAEMVGLEDRIREADLVITGEGRIDSQTRFGKTPFGVAQMAVAYGKPVIAVAGTVDPEASELYGSGIRVILPIIDRPISLEEAIKRAPELLEQTGDRISRMLSLDL